MSETQRPQIGWSILEVMGHRRLGGYLSEQTIAGVAMLRIDVPGDGDTSLASQFYHPSAVFCITPTTEEVARAVAAHNRPEPVHRWELPRPADAAAILEGEVEARYRDDDEDDP